MLLQKKALQKKALQKKALQKKALQILVSKISPATGFNKHS